MPCNDIDNIEGIRVQGICEAILSSQHIIMLDRLLEAISNAENQNLISAQQAHDITRELYIND